MNDDLQAKVAEIRERAKSHRAMNRMDRTMYATAVVDAMIDDIDTLLAALDAERAATRRGFDVARVMEWLDTPDRKEAIHAFTEGPERQAAYLCETAVLRYRDAIERGEHREGRDA